jgi:hypothetical protein
MMTIDERVERLTGIVESLARTVVAHDNQIESLITVAEKQNQRLDKVSANLELLERQWQAYLNTLPHH